tara:strand:+ start:123 stop:1034 length:912 start_codon:yes stop_codon:yes gene_type:complete
MSKKYSSFKDFQLITENWRKFLNEEEAPSPLQKVADKLAEPSTPLPQYVAILKKYASDPAFRQLALAGHTDAAGPQDEQVSVKRTAIAANDLRATQAEIGFSNSLADQVTNKYNATKTALGLEGEPIIMPSADDPPPAILIYNGSYILDGHHRWSQVMMTNPTGVVAVDNVTGPAIDDEEEALKTMQLAIAAAAGNVVTKPFKGANLMQATPEQVYGFVVKEITDEVLQLLVQTEKIAEPSKEAAGKYYAGNLGVIKKAQGKFSREKSMPQAGKSGTSQGTVNDLLGTGKVNFDLPAASDVKK